MAKKAEKKNISKTEKSTPKDAGKAVQKKAASRLNGTDQVNEYMAKLEHPLKAEVEAVRKIILGASSKIGERIKWNSPSFYYKEDLAAFHLRPQDYIHLVLIFPKGLIKESSGLLEGDYKDRRMAYFYDMKDVKSKEESLKRVVIEWVKLMDK
jgi:hypothetical protein